MNEPTFDKELGALVGKAVNGGINPVIVMGMLFSHASDLSGFVREESRMRKMQAKIAENLHANQTPGETPIILEGN